MMERKFTDDEIVKALEICSQNIVTRHNGLTYEGIPLRFLFEEAFDLINRQKADIERYEKTVGKLAVSKDGIVTGMLNGKETEYIQKSVADVFRNMAVNRAKTEAIKEFAERLLDKYDIWTESDATEYQYVAELTGNLVKEMTND